MIGEGNGKGRRMVCSEWDFASAIRAIGELKRSLRNISPMPQLPSSSGNRFLRALRLVEMTKRKSSVEMTEEGVPFDTSSFHQKGWPGRDFAMQSRKGEKAKGFGDLPRNKRG